MLGKTRSLFSGFMGGQTGGSSDPLDEFDFGEEITFDGGIENDDRTPVSSAVVGFKEGLMDEIRQPGQFADEFIKSNMPKDVTTEYTRLKDIKYEASNEFDKIVKDVKPDAMRLAASVKRLAPEGNMRRLAGQLSARLGLDPEEKQESEKARREKEVTGHLDSIFNRQAHQQVRAEADGIIREQIRDKKVEAQTTTTQGLLASIKDSSANQLSYTLEVNAKYQRTHLELQYKHVFLTQQLLETTARFHTRTGGQLEAVTKNTSLPEYMKVHLSEMAHQATLQNILARTGDMLFGEGSYFSTRVENVKNWGMDKIRGMSQGIGIAATAAEGIEQAREMGQGKSAAELAAAEGGGAALRYGAGKLFNKARERNDGDNLLNNSVKGFTEFLDRTTRKLETRMNDWATGDEGVLGTAREFVGTHASSALKYGDAAFKLDPNVVKKDYSLDGPMYNSIVTVIPELLSMIHQEAKGIRTGDVGERAVYDHSKKTMSTDRAISNSLVDTISKSSRNNTMRDATKTFITEQMSDVVGEDPEKIKQLQKYILSLAAKANVTGKFDLIDKGDLADKSGKYYGIEDEELKATLIEYLDENTNIRGIQKLENNFANVRSELTAQQKLHGTDSLVRSGLMSPDEKGDLRINQERLTDVMSGDYNREAEKLSTRHINEPIVGPQRAASTEPQGTLNTGFNVTPITNGLSGLNDLLVSIDNNLFDLIDHLALPDTDSDDAPIDLDPINLGINNLHHVLTSISHNTYAALNQGDYSGDTDQPLPPPPIPPYTAQSSTTVDLGPTNLGIVGIQDILSTISDDFKTFTDEHRKPETDETLDPLPLEVQGISIDVMSAMQTSLHNIEEATLEVATNPELTQVVESGIKTVGLLEDILTQMKSGMVATSDLVNMFADLRERGGRWLSNRRTRDWSAGSILDGFIDKVGGSLGALWSGISGNEHVSNVTGKVDKLIEKVGSGLRTGAGLVADITRGGINLTQLGIEQAKKLPGRVWKAGKGFVSLFKSEGAIDVYTTANLEENTMPVLTRIDMEAGKYTNAEGGVIKKVSDIRGPVYDAEGIRLTQEDIDKGLYDEAGNKLNVKWIGRVENVVKRFFGIKNTIGGISTKRLSQDVYTRSDLESGVPSLTRKNFVNRKYFDRNGKAVTSSRDIRGAVYHMDDGLVLTSAEVEEGLFNQYGKPLATGMIGIVSSSLTGRLVGVVKDTYKWTMRRMATDVYTLDDLREESGPSLTRKGFIRKHYVAKDGTLLTDETDIEGAVYHTDGSLLISEEQYNQGLYDKNGDKLTSGILSMAASGVKTVVSFLKRGIALPGNILKSLTTKFLNGVDSLFDIGSVQNKQLDVLNNIYTLLDTRLGKPGAPAPTVFGDRDGDGDRDGSAEDLRQQREEPGAGNRQEDTTEEGEGEDSPKKGYLGKAISGLGSILKGGFSLLSGLVGPLIGLLKSPKILAGLGLAAGAYFGWNSLSDKDDPTTPENADDLLPNGATKKALGQSLRGQPVIGPMLQMYDWATGDSEEDSKEVTEKKSKTVTPKSSDKDMFRERYDDLSWYQPSTDTGKHRSEIVKINELSLEGSNGSINGLRMMQYGIANPAGHWSKPVINIINRLEILILRNGGVRKSGDSWIFKPSNQLISALWRYSGLTDDTSEQNKYRYNRWLNGRFIPVLLAHVNASTALGLPIDFTKPRNILPKQIAKYLQISVRNIDNRDVIYSYPINPFVKRLKWGATDEMVKLLTDPSAIMDQADRMDAEALRIIASRLNSEHNATKKGYLEVHRNRTSYGVTEKSDVSKRPSLNSVRRGRSVPTELADKLGTDLSNVKPTPGESLASQLDMVYGNKYKLLKDDNASKGEAFTGVHYNLKGVTDASITNLDPAVRESFLLMAREYYETTGDKINLNSGWRGNAEQAALKGSKGKYAAGAGGSTHEYGFALDINSADAKKLMESGLLNKYGFNRPMQNGEKHHIEPTVLQGRMDYFMKNPGLMTMMFDKGKGVYSEGFGELDSVKGAGPRRDHQVAFKLPGGAKEMMSKYHAAQAVMPDIETTPKPGALPIVPMDVNPNTQESSTVSPVLESVNVPPAVQPVTRLPELKTGRTVIDMTEKAGVLPKPKVGLDRHQDILTLIEEESIKMGMDPNIMKLIFAKESSLNPSIKNSGSSATGLGQATEAMWKDWTRSKVSKQYPNDRKDPRANAAAGAWYIKTYLPMIQKYLDGRQANTLENYLVTLMGPGDGPEFAEYLRDKPDVTLDKFMGSNRITGNKKYFMTDGRVNTVAETYKAIDRSLAHTAKEFNLPYDGINSGTVSPIVPATDKSVNKSTVSDTPVPKVQREPSVVSPVVPTTRQVSLADLLPVNTPPKTPTVTQVRGLDGRTTPTPVATPAPIAPRMSVAPVTPAPSNQSVTTVKVELGPVETILSKQLHVLEKIYGVLSTPPVKETETEVVKSPSKPVAPQTSTPGRPKSLPAAKAFNVDH